MHFKNELQFLNRLKLEFDAVKCSCGESWINTDAYDLIIDRMTELIEKDQTMGKDQEGLLWPDQTISYTL